MKLRCLIVAMMVCGGTVAPSVVSASSISFNVSVDTSGLIGHPAGPFSLDFQLTDGTGTGDGNNTATLTDFLFGGGSAIGSPTLVGGSSGSLGAGALLSDTSFLNEITQSFMAGSTLAFNVNLTTNVDAGVTPDEFSFAILDNGGNDLPTLGFFDAFVVIDISSANPTISAFASDPARGPVAGGDGIAIPRPVITPLPAAQVPEPGSIVLLGTGLAIVRGLWRKRTKSVPF